MLRHEIDLIGRRELRGDYDIAFILPVFGIDQNERPPGSRVLDDMFDRRNGAFGKRDSIHG
jgi:hypothetical protein